MHTVRNVFASGFRQSLNWRLVLPLYLTGLVFGLVQTWPVWIYGEAAASPHLARVAVGEFDALANLLIGSEQAQITATMATTAWVGISLMMVLLYGLARPLRRAADRPRALDPLLIFALAQFGVWTLGVVWSDALWQSRLLLPCLAALTPIVGWIWADLPRFDLPSFSLSRCRSSSDITSKTTLTALTPSIRDTPRTMSSFILAFMGQPATVRLIPTVTLLPSISTDFTMSSSVRGFRNSGSSIPLKT